jgi:hypothetical protein
MWTLILNSLYFVASLAGLRGGQPRVRLGGTTFIGKRLETPNLEFFGGPVILSHHFSIIDPLTLAFRYPFR